MSFSNNAETLVLEWLLTAGSPTRPTAWHVALFTAAPGEAGGGTEVSGNAYAREAVTFAVSGNNASNNADLEFPTATGSWGTITHAGIFDASSGGNLIAYAALSASKTIESGDVFRIPNGDFDINLD